MLVYIPCKSVDQAETIGKSLLLLRLCACINIYPDMRSVYFWPPGKNELESASESVLIAKTTTSLLPRLEAEVKRLHTYTCPCIMSVPVSHVNKEYGDWLMSEMEVPVSKKE
jgi:periplasmic divalent cation tolerance protein